MIWKTSRKARKPIPSSSYPTITFECLCPISPPSILAIGLEVNNEPVSWGLQFGGRSGVSPTARFWTEVLPLAIGYIMRALRQAFAHNLSRLELRR
jgi:hypothetical protein